MEAIPLGKALGGVGAILLGPNEHFRLKVDASALAELADRLFGAVEQVVGIHDRQMPLVDNIVVNQKVEEAHQLLVASFIGHKLLKAMLVA